MRERPQLGRKLPFRTGPANGPVSDREVWAVALSAHTQHGDRAAVWIAERIYQRSSGCALFEYRRRHKPAAGRVDQAGTQAPRTNQLSTNSVIYFRTDGE